MVYWSVLIWRNYGTRNTFTLSSYRTNIFQSLHIVTLSDLFEMFYTLWTCWYNAESTNIWCFAFANFITITIGQILLLYSVDNVFIHLNSTFGTYYELWRFWYNGNSTNIWCFAFSNFISIIIAKFASIFCG